MTRVLIIGRLSIGILAIPTLYNAQRPSFQLTVRSNWSLATECRNCFILKPRLLVQVILFMQVSVVLLFYHNFTGAGE